MNNKERPSGELCTVDFDAQARYRRHLPQILQEIIESSHATGTCSHVDFEPIPSKDAVIEILNKFFEILYPGYFNPEKLDPININYHIGQSVSQLYNMLGEQISNSIQHDCNRYYLSCQECYEKGYDISLKVLKNIPSLQKILASDVQATYEGDPAAKSYDEIVFSYPGIFATTVYRIAHLLHEHEIPMLPRIMTEYAHSWTGIDIHPGSQIAENFVIDHGTGVVIGETTHIGKNVRIYQGVTIGALSLSKEECERLRDQKRHPTIEDDVIIYSGATILGGNTVIGARSTIGGNVWLTESVPPDTQVFIEKPRLVYKQ